jgi:hypothetical protein
MSRGMQKSPVVGTENSPPSVDRRRFFGADEPGFKLILEPIGMVEDVEGNRMRQEVGC